MRRARLRIFAGRIDRTDVLQIFVERISGEIAVENVVLRLDSRSILVPGGGLAILERDVRDVLASGSLESVGDDGVFLFAELHDPEVNLKGRVLRLCHAGHECGDSEVVAAWKHGRPAALCGVVVKDDHRLPGLDDGLHSFRIILDVACRSPERHVV